MARILVIDDDPGMRELLAHTLQADGHEALCAANGQEGLALQRETPAALAFVDVVMPVKDGIVTIHELRQLTPDLAIVAITGHPKMGQILLLAQRLGASKLLQKPFQPQELLNLVGEMLARP